MNNNSLGSWAQVIRIQVPSAHASLFLRRLGEKFKGEVSGGTHLIVEWTRWSTRKANDEDIVFELSHRVGFDIDWEIDWQNSIY